MIDADKARKLSKQNRKLRAKTCYDAAMSKFEGRVYNAWKYIEGMILEAVSKGHDSVTIKVPNILCSVTERNEIWSLLHDMNFSVDPSFSDNPENERWFIRWGTRK
jgi:hypothetical protein